MAVSQSNHWDKIRLGVREAENLIRQKKYNLAMVRCRQTLEYMIRDLCDKAMIPLQNSNQDMSSLIDELYTNRWISKTTCEHYHKIRMLGNKAVHDGSDSSYDANQAYHLLTQEVYTFSKDFHTAGGSDPRQGETDQNGSRPRKSRQNPREGQPDTRNRPRNSREGQPNSRPRQQNPSNGQRPDGQARSRKRQNNEAIFTGTVLARLLLILAAVLIVFLVVRLVRGGKAVPEETTAPPETTTEAPLPETTPAPETMAETTPAAVFKTNDYLNVRAEPSTDGQKLGVLEPDTIVEYVEEYDDEWAVILFEGNEAYVASRYLVHD